MPSTFKLVAASLLIVAVLAIIFSPAAPAAAFLHGKRGSLRSHLPVIVLPAASLRVMPTLDATVVVDAFALVAQSTGSDLLALTCARLC